MSYSKASHFAPKKATAEASWHWPMSLADKVAALRAFGVKPEVQLLPAVEAMHTSISGR